MICPNNSYIRVTFAHPHAISFLHLALRQLLERDQFGIPPQSRRSRRIPLSPIAILVLVSIEPAIGSLLPLPPTPRCLHPAPTLSHHRGSESRSVLDFSSVGCFPISRGECSSRFFASVLRRPMTRLASASAGMFLRCRMSDVPRVEQTILKAVPSQDARGGRPLVSRANSPLLILPLVPVKSELFFPGPTRDLFFGSQRTESAVKDRLIINELSPR